MRHWAAQIYVVSFHVPSVAENNRDFWKSFPELCWSNRNASDSVHIRAALCRPRFECLVEIADRFGIDRLREEWRLLTTEGSVDVKRAASIVERILGNIERGFCHAEA